MRAIGYFRIRADEEATLPEMERAFIEFCHFNLHQPVETIVSVAGDGTDEDAEYRRMVDQMRETGKEFLVVVPGADHLGSDLEAVARSLTELDAIGAKVACSDEDYPDPVQNAFHTLGIKGVSSTRSARIKESMRARASQGQALGRPLYGYRIGAKGTLEVVPEEAPVVELLYRLYTKDGMGLRLLAQHLNERGIPTRRGGKWNVVSIRDILKNPAYTGTYTRLGMRRPKVHDAIIQPEVFRAAQDQTRERRPIGRVVQSEPFLLSRSVYCGYCGNKMMGVTRRQSWRRKDGQRAKGVYRYYQCQSRNNLSTCGYHTWRAPLLESTVLGHLRYVLQAKASEPPDPAKQEEAGAMREAAIRNAERRLLQAMKRAARGDINIKAIGSYLRDLDAARRIDADQEHADPAATLDNWDSLDLETRRTFIARHVARITVEDDKVEVVV